MTEQVIPWAHTCPFWKFWDFESGIIGGMLLGLVCVSIGAFLLCMLNRGSRG